MALGTRVSQCNVPEAVPDAALEMGGSSWPTTCHLEPHPKVCYQHYRRFQHAYAGGEDSASSPPLAVEFQIYYILTVLMPFQALFQPLRPSSTITRNSVEASQDAACWLLEAGLALHEHASDRETFTWDSAAEHLEECSLISKNSQPLGLSQYFAFCLTGALTCLFTPTSPGSASPFAWNRYQIETSCSSPSHWFWCFLTDSNEENIQLPVGDFLAGLGEILPLTDGSGKTMVEGNCLLDPDKVNADVLTGTLSMKIKWTDILGAHLDVDDTTNTLFLFRQPTLCLLNTGGAYAAGTLLQSCVVDSIVKEEKLKHLMQEILLSLYVLFGQQPKSHRAFSEREVFPEAPSGMRDPLLQEICGGRWRFRDFRCRPTRIYSIGDSFPHLGAKLAFLVKHTQYQEPKTIKAIWKDKRNTVQWWTFWAVIVLGILGLILSTAQTILGGIAVRYASSTAIISTSNQIQA